MVSMTQKSGPVAPNAITYAVWFSSGLLIASKSGSRAMISTARISLEAERLQGFARRPWDRLPGLRG